MLHNRTMRAAAISTTIISLLSSQSCDAFLSSSGQRTSALFSSSSINNLPATSVGDKSRKLQSCRASSTPLFMSAPAKVPDTIHELAAEAQTTPQMMRVLWQLAADASKNMQKGVSYHQHHHLCVHFRVQLQLINILQSSLLNHRNHFIDNNYKFIQSHRTQPPSSCQAWNKNFPTQYSSAD